MWVVVSNIVIGLYLLDMWSVLCVPYLGGTNIVIVYTGHVVSVCFWVVGSNIVIGLYCM